MVTGGSRGIGAATAVRAAARGYDVALNFRSNEAAAAEVVTAVETAGRRAIAIAGDVADEHDVVALFEQATAELGPITAVVNNAGILHEQARLDTFSKARLDEVMAVNVIGAFLVAREAVRAMSTAHGGGGGAIVNVGSAASYLGSANEFIDYAATKGAIDTMTIGLAREVATEGVRVNCVRPGLIHTDIHSLSGEEARVERLAPNVPMQRGGEAEEVADAILYLLSDEAGYVTGSLLNVSGGR